MSRIKVCMIHKEMFDEDRGCVCCNIDDILLEEAGYIRPDVKAMRFMFGQERHVHPKDLIKKMEAIIEATED